MNLGGWPSEKAFFDLLEGALFAAAAGTFLSLIFINAPYGRHFRRGFGWTISNRLGWILMEIPSVAVFAAVYAMGESRSNSASCVLALMWLAHYLYRTGIYPNLIRSAKKPMPVSIALTGAGFNTINSYLNARWLSQFGNYSAGWLKEPQFVFGATLFFIGMVIHIHSDQILIHLRKPGETGYLVPRGGLFRFVSSPNYFGEIVEWLGWAVATSSQPGLLFLLFTVANLAPRALTHHRWYQGQFRDQYPRDRKALIPKLW